MLYSLLGYIDFISVSPLKLECWNISMHWHAENTSSITININLRFLPGGICPRHTSSNTRKSERHKYIFYPPRLPLLIFTHTVSLKKKKKNQLFLLCSPEKQQQHSRCDCFLSLCVHVRAALDLACVCDCVCLCILYVCAVLIAASTWGTRMDHCKEGRAEDNTQTTRMAKRMKETQNEPHINLRQEERFI